MLNLNESELKCSQFEFELNHSNDYPNIDILTRSFCHFFQMIIILMVLRSTECSFTFYEPEQIWIQWNYPIYQTITSCLQFTGWKSFLKLKLLHWTQNSNQSLDNTIDYTYSIYVAFACKLSILYIRNNWINIQWFPEYKNISALIDINTMFPSEAQACMLTCIHYGINNRINM